MPTHKTELAKKLDSISAKQRPSGFEVGVALLCLTATYITTGTEAATDVIDIGEIPAGAQLVPSLSRVISEGIGGTGATIAKLGDATVDNRYSTTAIALTAAGVVAVTPTNAVALIPYTVTPETTRIKATLALASGSITAGKRVRFELIYRMPGH